MPKTIMAIPNICLWLFVVCTPFEAFAEQPKVLSVSIVSLIANPEKYEDKRISVTGFLHIGFEDTAIYLHQDDYQNSITQNGLWIFLPNNTDSISDFPGGCQSNRYVQVIGTFSTKFKGHMGAWSGSIQSTEMCNFMLRAD